MLKALQGHVRLTNNPFFCSIWAPSLGISWPPPVQDGSTKPLVSSPLIYYPGGTLNASQDIAVERICSEADKDRIVLIQGPPGTGKTTVIAASVLSIMEYGDKERTIWLVAHSNVAVKNIAEKLDKVGFREFKLLVSHGFHYDWCVAFCTTFRSLSSDIAGMNTSTSVWNIALYRPTCGMADLLLLADFCWKQGSYFAR